MGGWAVRVAVVGLALVSVVCGGRRGGGRGRSKRKEQREQQQLLLEDGEAGVV
jgi:hypothetical protein